MVAESKNKPLTSLSGGETGKIYFQSSNPRYFTEILDGADNDSKVNVFGILQIPKNIKGKVPVIVIVHGGFGWNDKKEKRYIKTFNKMGIGTFRLSCFKPRLSQGVAESIHNVPLEMAISDAYNALNLLSTHPKIDKNRIGLMGFSYGGMVTLVSAWEPIRKTMANGDLKFALHIALYSYCWQFEKLQMTGKPILILSAEKDDWVPTDLCLEFTKDMKDAGYDANIIVYPDAHHSFDGQSKMRLIKNGFSTAKCRYEIKSDGVIVETNSGLKIDSLEMEMKAWEACMKKGAHIGMNKSAKKKSMEDIINFLTKNFGL
jgi:dienelactone hydrolase